MSASARSVTAERSGTNHIVVQTPGFAWALAALQVEQISPLSDWQGNKPFDLAAHLGLSSTDAQARVLRVALEGRRLAILAKDPIVVRNFPISQIIDVPAFVAPKTARLTQGMVFESDRSSAVFVIRAAALADAFGSTVSSASGVTQFPSSVKGTS